MAVKPELAGLRSVGLVVSARNLPWMPGAQQATLRPLWRSRMPCIPCAATNCAFHTLTQAVVCCSRV